MIADLDAIRRRLADPARVVAQLGLSKNAKRQGGGVLICCPAHNDRSPSCSVTVGDGGTLRVRCFGCELAGDVFSLVAAARGLSERHDFLRVLGYAAELAGVAVEQGAAAVAMPSPPPPRPSESSRDYPAFNAIAAAWAALDRIYAESEPSAPLDAGSIADLVELLRAEKPSTTPEPRHQDVVNYLRSRAIDPQIVDELQLARVIPAGEGPWRAHPMLAWFAKIGVRIVLPCFDLEGKMRSLRGWRICGDDGPKRLALKGYRASGLVLCDATAIVMLRGLHQPSKVFILEGEPDFVSAATLVSDADEDAPAIIGIGSGSWSAALAQRIPKSAVVYIRTHDDPAGHKYRDEIIASLRPRGVAMRVARSAS